MSDTYLKHIAAHLPETLPTHVRTALGLQGEPTRFDTVLMGRATYEPARLAQIPSPYAPLRQYVFSHSLPPSTDPTVTVIAGDPVPLVRPLKAEDTDRDIWLCGGGDLATQLIGEIDELLIKLNPVVLGQGVPLFRSVPDTSRFVYSGQALHDGGILWLCYAAAGHDSVKTDG